MSLWRGFGATVWRDVPFSGVYWFTYENAKSFLTKHRVRALVREQEHKAAAAGLSASPAAPQLGFLDTFGVSFGSGVAAGGLSALITTPWDVIKTRTQVAGMPGQPAATAAHPHGQLPSGTAAALLHIARHEGPTGLFAGVSARVAKVAPACAIMIGSYELGKMVFAKCFPTTSAPASADGSSPSTLASMALEASASAHDASKGVNNDEAQA